jgi:hypothetical protein
MPTVGTVPLAATLFEEKLSAPLQADPLAIGRLGDRIHSLQDPA